MGTGWGEPGWDGHMGTRAGGREHCGHGKVLVGLIGGFLTLLCSFSFFFIKTEIVADHQLSINREVSQGCDSIYERLCIGASWGK